MIQTPVLETPRLILRPLCREDAPAMQAQFPRWEIVRLMDGAIPWPYPDDGCLTYLTTVALPAAAAGEAWHWSIRRKAAPDALIGVVSLMLKPDDNRGFWLSTDHQGQGLMIEASSAATDFWFEGLGHPVLRVPKAADNAASRRISERVGMRVVETFDKALVCGVHPCELWEITHEAWRAYRAGTAATTGQGPAATP
jgi:RimJ/RimL family protein N-acetyltransferase